MIEGSRQTYVTEGVAQEKSWVGNCGNEKGGRYEIENDVEMKEERREK